MKYLWILLFSLVFSADQTIKINKKKLASTFNNDWFEGFGSSFCWWPNRLGYSDTLTEKSVIAFYEKIKV